MQTVCHQGPSGLPRPVASYSQTTDLLSEVRFRVHTYSNKALHAGNSHRFLQAALFL